MNKLITSKERSKLVRIGRIDLKVKSSSYTWYKFGMEIIKMGDELHVYLDVDKFEPEVLLETLDLFVYEDD